MISQRSKRVVLGLAIVWTVASFVTVARVIPAANQAFRVAAYMDPGIAKGSAELTLDELSQRIDTAMRAGDSPLDVFDLGALLMSARSRGAAPTASR